MVIIMVKREDRCVLNAVFYAVILNLVLPMLAKPFATPEELKPADVSQLSFKSKVMHMLVHHEMTPVASSLVVGLIVGLAIFLGYKFKVF